MNKKSKDVLIDWLNRLSQITIVAFILTPFVTDKFNYLLAFSGFVISLGSLFSALRIASTVEEAE